MKIIISFFILFLVQSTLFSYLTIDTNLLNMESKNNSQTKTNIEPMIIFERELPTSYLKTGIISYEDEETVLRRFDIMFFISIPISFYLVQNFVQQKNAFIYNGAWQLRDDSEWLFVFVNTLLIPMVVSYNDFYLMEKRREKEKNLVKDIPFYINIPLLAVNF